MTRLFLLILFIFCGSLLAKAEADADSTANRLKGGIWYLTAKRICSDRNLKPIPPKWKSNAAFKSWVYKQGKKDRIGLVGLWTEILKTNAGMPVSPQQLADEIIGQVRQPAQANQSSLKKVNADSLEADLNRFLKANPSKSAVGDESGKKGTASVKDENWPSSENKASYDESSESIGGARTDDASEYNKTDAGGILVNHPFAILSFLSIFAFLLGVIAALYYKYINTANNHSSNSTNSSNNSYGVSRDRYNKLQRDYDELLSDFTTLRKANLGNSSQQSVQAELGGGTTDTIPRLVSNQSESVEASNEVVVQKAESIIPTPAIQARYGPAERGAYIKDSRVVDRAMDKLPITLSFNSNNPDRATFALNPGVNQEWLIRVGLEQLREYFDFKMPITRPVSVAADGSGQLTRQGEGWQVTTRAKLTIR